MENIIRKHIEELCQAEGHEALRANYEDSKQDIKGCCLYIIGEARKLIKGSQGMVEDPVVYGWAVHYFIEKLYNQPAPKVEAEVVAPAPAPAKVKKVLHVKDVTPAAPETKANLLFDFNEL